MTPDKTPRTGRPPCLPNYHEKYRRRSIRLRGYDYSYAGAYFVTICTQNRNHLFGNIAGGEMALNDAGKMIKTIWHEIPSHYVGTDIDECIVMPNHLHGIIVLAGAPPRGVVIPVGAPHCGCPISGQAQGPENGQAQGPENGQAQGPENGQAQGPENGQAQGPENGQAQGPENGQAQGPAPTVLSLGDVVHRFKTMTTKRYIDGVKQLDWQPFPGKLWQRNYWEHIIRNDTEWKRIREYIHTNPAEWEFDRMNSCSRMDDDPHVVRQPIAAYAAEEWMI
jgi:putative transposase